MRHNYTISRRVCVYEEKKDECVTHLLGSYDDERLSLDE